MSSAGINLRALWALRDDRTLSAADWKVAMALVSFSDERGVCRPGLRRLAAAARTSPGGARRSLEHLEKEGGPIVVRVERERWTEHGDRDTHRYVISLPVGCDQGNPTCDQTDPTVGSPVPQGCDQGNPRGGVPVITEEDILNTGEEDTEEKKRVRDVFERWSSKLWSKVHPDRQPKASQKRLKPIRARLRDGFTVEQLDTVIARVAGSNWHLGENDQGRVYIEPETIFRNREKVDEWLAAKPALRKGPHTQHGVAAGVDMSGRGRWHDGPKQPNSGYPLPIEREGGVK